MHELSLAQNIIEIIKEEMPKHNLTKVDTVTLKIGEMAQVMPDALLFGFECLGQGTPFEGAKIFIETIPVKGYCRICGLEFDMKGLCYNCPVCGQTDVEIISGRELEIAQFEGS